MGRATKDRLVTVFAMVMSFIVLALPFAAVLRSMGPWFW
jgi:hypothetical protein